MPGKTEIYISMNINNQEHITYLCKLIVKLGPYDLRSKFTLIRQTMWEDRSTIRYFMDPLVEVRLGKVNFL